MTWPLGGQQVGPGTSKAEPSSCCREEPGETVATQGLRPTAGAGTQGSAGGEHSQLPPPPP